MGEKRAAWQKAAIGLAHSATVAYLARISELELVNSELEIEVKVAKAENGKLREQARYLKSEAAKRRNSDQLTTELTKRVDEMAEEIGRLRSELLKANEEKEEMSRLLSACNRRLGESREEMAILKAGFHAKRCEEMLLRGGSEAFPPEMRPKSEFENRFRMQSKLAAATSPLADDHSERLAFTEVSHDLLQLYNLEEVNEQHSPNRPYRPEDLLFASAGRRKEEQGKERQRSASAHGVRKRCMSRASSKTGLGLVKYVPSSLRTVRKQKLCEEPISHVNVPRVSETKVSPYLRIRGSSLDDEFPDDLDLPLYQT